MKKWMQNPKLDVYIKMLPQTHISKLCVKQYYVRWLSSNANNDMLCYSSFFIPIIFNYLFLKAEALKNVKKLIALYFKRITMEVHVGLCIILEIYRACSKIYTHH
jgi:hypothetical protein